MSTSALPEGLSPAEIDAVVKQRMAAGEDLYHLDRGAFADLDPTLVVTQDLSAVCAVDVSEVDDALQWLGCRADVVTLDPATLDEVLDSVRTVGAATGTSERAAAIVAARRDQLATIEAAVEGAPRPRTLVLEWTDPAFTAGHWVPDLVVAAGGEPVLGRRGEKSVGVAWPEIAACEAEVVIVAPCGYRLDGTGELAAMLSTRSGFPQRPRCGPWMPTPSSSDPAPGWSTGLPSSPRSFIPAAAGRPMRVRPARRLTGVGCQVSACSSSRPHWADLAERASVSVSVR